MLSIAVKFCRQAPRVLRGIQSFFLLPLEITFSCCQMFFFRFAEYRDWRSFVALKVIISSQLCVNAPPLVRRKARKHVPQLKHLSLQSGVCLPKPPHRLELHRHPINVMK